MNVFSKTTRSALLASLAGAAHVVFASTAGAQTPPPIMTHVEEPSSSSDSLLGPPRGEPRHFAITYNPLTIQIERISANLEILLASHHGLVLTPYYATTTTNEDSFNNQFRGFGGEIGYRHYSGFDGPRGIFFGPSLLVGAFEAIPMSGETKHFWNLGAAFDVGYQAVIADRWVVGLGGGLQYTVPTVTFPKQELPASIYAQRGLRPRLLLSIGVAFD